MTIDERAENVSGLRRWLRFRTGAKPSRALGQGTAWLVFDAGGDLYQYQCYWFGGRGGDHVLEHARSATAADAVKWATARTPRARIRLADHRTYWAGAAPKPGGLAGTWTPDRPERHPTVRPDPAGPLASEATAAVAIPSPRDDRSADVSASRAEILSPSPPHPASAPDSTTPSSMRLPSQGAEGLPGVELLA